MPCSFDSNGAAGLGAKIGALLRAGLCLTVLGSSQASSLANVLPLYLTSSPAPGLTVNLGWSASPTTTVVGYNLCWGLASGQCTNQLDAGNVTNAIVGGLVPDTVYYFTAVAYDAAGQFSVPCNEVQYSLPSSTASLTLCGTVYSSAGTPLAGATMTLSGGTTSTTDSSGSYCAQVPSGWSGTVTPSLVGCTFSPASSSYSNLTANQVGQDYTGSLQPAYLTSETLGSPRSDYDAWVGIKILVGTNPITISALGRWCASGNSGTHTVKLVEAATGLDVPNGSVAIALAGAPAGQFRYGALSSPVTLSANATYYLVSQEVSGADQWYSYNTAVTTMPVAQCFGAAYLLNGVWRTVGTASNALGPVDFKYTIADPAASFTLCGVAYSSAGTPLAGVTVNLSSGIASITDSSGSYCAQVPSGWTGTVTPSLVGYSFSPASCSYSNVMANQVGQNYSGTAILVEAAYLTSETLGTLRSDYNAWMGMKILVGTNPVTVSALGRWCASGNSGTHTVKLVEAATGLDVPDGSVVISLAGATPGQFHYGSLASPVTLASNATYYLVSQEVSGADQWCSYNTTVTTMPVAQCLGVAYQLNGVWATVGTASNILGPVDFKYLIPAVTGSKISGPRISRNRVSSGSQNEGTVPGIEIRSVGARQIHLQVRGQAGQVYRIFSSTNLIDWVQIGVAPVDAQGWGEFDDKPGADSKRFYRLVLR